MKTIYCLNYMRLCNIILSKAYIPDKVKMCVALSLVQLMTGYQDQPNKGTTGSSSLCMLLAENIWIPMRKSHLLFNITIQKHSNI